MRRNLRVIINGLAVSAFTAMVCATAIVARAQDREQYVISAKAGGVNAVSGKVMVTRKGADSAQPVSIRDDLASGDRLMTGAEGRVEVLLDPGSYLRLAENSELELTDASLDALRLKLFSGSAIVEVTGADEALSPIEVATPHTQIAIERKGFYRVDVRPEGSTVLRVRKGRALVGGTKVKDGRELSVDESGAMDVAKFDRNLQDSFDLWSGQRAEALTAANRRLSKDTLASAYSSYRSGPFRWLGGRRTFGGFWIYDPFFSGYTFLPYYSGWSSPYGFGYHNGFGFRRYTTGFSGFGFGHRHYGIAGHTIHGSGHRSFGHHGGGHFGGGHHGGRH